MGKRSREKRERFAQRSFSEGQAEERRIVLSQSGLEKACLFVIRWGTYLVLFTPLIVLTAFFFPFVAPKTIFFRVIVEIIFGVYLFLVITDKKYWPRINILTISLSIFLAIFILTSFTGINLDRSFWSTNERMTGIWTMLHLFAFFIILTSCFKKREDWEKFLGVSIIVGVLLSLYVLKGSEISTRGGGTIGNTSFMAAYLLFNIFFALLLFLAKRGGWQIFAGVSLIPMLWVLFTSNARGAIVAFLGGLFLLGLGYLFFSRIRVLKRIALALVLLLVILGILAALFQPAFLVDKIKHTLKEMKSRFVVWEKGWKGFLERPILGWGPENFNVVFLKYFNPCVFLSECGGEIWFDRAHNIVFDTLINSGLIGLLSYLVIFGTALYGLFKIIPKIGERRNIFLPLGMAVLLIVYFFQNLLVFDMINSYLVFFLSLSFINFLIFPPKEEVQTKAKSLQPLWAVLIIIPIILILWLGNIQPLQANHFLIKALQAQNVEEVEKFFKKSLSSLMNNYEPREQFVQRIIRIAPEVPQENKQSFQPFFQLAETEMEKSIKENSLDFRPHLFLGQLYLADYRFSGDKEKLNLAEKILQKAITLSPTNQQGYWNLAEVRLAQGRFEQAASLLQKAIDLEPRLANSHRYLAKLYQITGNDQLAKQSYLEALKLQPNDARLWAELAASYANLGQFEKAKEAAQKVKELNPDLAPQVEKFLKEIE